ncbi:MAG: nuclear transport factor 2 family protein [Verrucomicrobiota bacterium]
MKTTYTALSLAFAMATLGVGQEPDTPSPEMAAVLANDRAYEEAYAKADVDGLANFFTADAEYTTDDGRSFKGNDSIKACLKDAFRDNKGAKISIQVDSVKPLSAEVVVEKGATTVFSKDGDEAESLYTAIHVKKDGAWKISQLIETSMPAISPSDRLAELSWLIGKWKDSDKNEGVTVLSQYTWAKGGSFITRNVTVTRGDEAILEGWQIIGWDPVEEAIHSWTFDDAGGYSQGQWSREGQRWLIRETGYTADGSRTSADQTISKTGDDGFSWESGNRTLDGDPQPSIGRIEIQRVKGE